MNTFKIVLLLIFVCLLGACESGHPNVELLERAQHLAETDPSKALTLLDSIRTPEALDEADYMDYIVTRVQAKVNANEDISGDTLIIRAKKYFDQHTNAIKQSEADYLTGSVYYSKRMKKEAFDAFLDAEHNAVACKNFLLAGKSSNFISYLYLEQELMDSVLVRSQQSLKYLNKIGNANIDPSKDRMKAYTQLGRAYDHLQVFDSAYYYIDKSYQLAKQLDDKQYIQYGIINLGVISAGMKEYDKAIDFSKQALALTTDTIARVKIYLNLARMYDVKQVSDSAKFYTGLIEQYLSNTKDQQTVTELYDAFYRSYKGRGNYELALHYKELEAKVNEEILLEDGASKLIASQKEYQIKLQEKEIARLKLRNYVFVSFVLLVVAGLFIAKKIKKRNERQKKLLELHKSKLIRTQNDLMEQRMDNYEFIQNVYEDIINQWTLLETQMRETNEKIYDENWMLYGRVRAWMNHLSTAVNMKFILAAKDFLLGKANGSKALEILDEDDLLLMMLLYNNYTDIEIERIVGEPFLEEKPLADRKQRLKQKLNTADVKLPI